MRRRRDGRGLREGRRGEGDDVVHVKCEGTYPVVQAAKMVDGALLTLCRRLIVAAAVVQRHLVRREGVAVVVSLALLRHPRAARGIL